MVHTDTLGGGTSTSQTQTSKQHCACEKNFCPICRLPTCRPSRDTKWAKGTLNTTYIRDYPEKSAARDLHRKPNELVPSLAGFNGETTNRADYGPKKATVERPRKDNLAWAHRPFDGQTTYNQYHNGKRGLGHDPRKLPPMLQSAPFAGISTKQADYIDHGNQCRPYTAPPWNIPDLRFDGTSTYQDDFIKKAMPPPLAKAPPQLLPSQNADNYTTYGTDYIEYPLGRVAGECCDHPHHPAHHIHAHDYPTMRNGASVLGNATGKLYKLR